MGTLPRVGAEGSDDVGGLDAGLVGLLVGQGALALPLGLDPAQVVVDLVVEAARVPAELAGHQDGYRAGGGDAAVEGLDGDPGAAGQHVVEVPGTLVGDRHLDDALTRRTRISIESFDRGTSSARTAAELMAAELGWDSARLEDEVDHYLRRVEAERQSQEMPTDQEADEARVSAPEGPWAV